MMLNSRDDFANYCLRQLGAPVVKIDVTEEQLNDRIDEAIDFWQQFNNEGTTRVFYKQLVTASVLTIKEQLRVRPLDWCDIEGVDSHATAKTCSYLVGNLHSEDCRIVCRDAFKDFIPGERIRVRNNPNYSDSGWEEYTLIDSPDCLVRGVIDTHCFKLPESILGVTNIIPFNDHLSTQNLLDFETQFRIASLVDLLNTDIINYTMVMEHYDLLSFQLNAKPQFRFNRHDGYVYPILHWAQVIRPGTFIVCDCMQSVNPDYKTRAWNDRWLKRYATALIQKQWGQNLSKYQNIQLAGGVTLNGQEMYQTAAQQAKDLEDELWQNMPPSPILIG